MSGIDRNTGRVLATWPHVQQSVEVIIMTRIGSRVMRRGFGSAVPELLGRNLLPATLLNVFMAIALALELWEPRFKVRKFAVTGSAAGLRAGTIAIDILGDYRPRALSGDFTVEDIRTISISGFAQ